MNLPGRVGLEVVAIGERMRRNPPLRVGDRPICVHPGLLVLDVLVVPIAQLVPG